MTRQKRPITWNSFTVIEYRPRKFVTKIDDEIVGNSTDADLMFYRILQKSVLVDADDIQVTLAVGALSAVMITTSTISFVKVVALISFVMSAFAFAGLSTVYLAKKMPNTVFLIVENFNSPNFIKIIFSLAWHWIVLVFTAMTNKADLGKDAELGFLSLFWALLFIFAAVLLWVLVSFINT